VDQLDLEHARAAEADRVKGRDGATHEASACGTTWRCRKARWASIRISRRQRRRDAAGDHVDTDAPLYSDRDGQ
jgi:hypothetical protein